MDLMLVAAKMPYPRGQRIRNERAVDGSIINRKEVAIYNSSSNIWKVEIVLNSQLVENLNCLKTPLESPGGVLVLLKAMEGGCRINLSGKSDLTSFSQSLRPRSLGTINDVLCSALAWRRGYHWQSSLSSRRFAPA